MNALIEKAKSIKCLICDLDGVLTDGILFISDANTEYKAFHVHDGMGLVLLRLSGITIGVITTSNSPIVERRIRDLGIQYVYQNQFNKIAAYEDLLQKCQLHDHEVAYIGDDLPDLALIQRCGLGVTVPNAIDKVREHADWITTKPAGAGAVRELCELIMHAQNTYQQAFDRYSTHGK